MSYLKTIPDASMRRGLRFPVCCLLLVPVLQAARGDVLAFLPFPQEHWRKV